MLNVVFCLLGLFHRYNRICEDFKFLTNVCHKHDIFLHKNKAKLHVPGRTCTDMRQVCPYLDRSTKSQIWILDCNSFGICDSTNVDKIFSFNLRSKLIL